MLAHLKILRALVVQQIKKVDSWAAETTGKVLSARATERLCYLRKDLCGILRQVSEILERVPDCEVEAAQEHPEFWLQLENDLTLLHMQDSELDGVSILILKEGADERGRANYGYLRYSVKLGEGLPV